MKMAGTRGAAGLLLSILALFGFCVLPAGASSAKTYELTPKVPVYASNAPAGSNVSYSGIYDGDAETIYAAMENMDCNTDGMPEGLGYVIELVKLNDLVSGYIITQASDNARILGSDGVLRAISVGEFIAADTVFASVDETESYEVRVKPVLRLRDNLRTYIWQNDDGTILYRDVYGGDPVRDGYALTWTQRWLNTRFSVSTAIWAPVPSVPVGPAGPVNSCAHLGVDGAAYSSDLDYHWKVCPNCGQIVNKMKHVHTVWVTSLAATTISDGEEYSDCDDCGYRTTRVIEKIGVPVPPAVPTAKTVQAKIYAMNAVLPGITKYGLPLGENLKAVNASEKIDSGTGYNTDNGGIYVLSSGVEDGSLNISQELNEYASISWPKLTAKAAGLNINGTMSYGTYAAGVVMVKWRDSGLEKNQIVKFMDHDMVFVPKYNAYAAFMAWTADELEAQAAGLEDGSWKSLIKIDETGTDDTEYVFDTPDINLDGNKNIYDSGYLMNVFRGSQSLVSAIGANDVTVRDNYIRCDLNCDGVVDSRDYLSWSDELMPEYYATAYFEAENGSVDPCYIRALKLDENGKPSTTGTAVIPDGFEVETRPWIGFDGGVWDRAPCPGTEIIDGEIMRIVYIPSIYGIEINVINGTASSKSMYVEYGMDAMISFGGNEGYVLYSADVDGEPVELTSYETGHFYRFRNVTSDHVITVTYGPPAAHTITVVDGFDGSTVNTMTDVPNGSAFPDVYSMIDLSAHDGYVFTGFDVEIPETVSGDCLLTALWTKLDKLGNEYFVNVTYGVIGGTFVAVPAGTPMTEDLSKLGPYKLLKTGSHGEADPNGYAYVTAEDVPEFIAEAIPGYSGNGFWQNDPVGKRVEKDVTFYWEFAPVGSSFTVKIIDGLDGNVKRIYGTQGASIIMSQIYAVIDPNAHEGYAFMGFDKDIVSTGTDCTLISQWTKLDELGDEYFATVTFEAGPDGTVTGATRVKILKTDKYGAASADGTARLTEDVIEAVNVSPNEGYAFDHWDPTLSVGLEVTDGTVFTAIFKTGYDPGGIPLPKGP